MCDENKSTQTPKKKISFGLEDRFYKDKNNLIQLFKLF